MKYFGLVAITTAFLTACSSMDSAPPEPLGPLAKEVVHAVTADGRLIRFNAGQPQKLLASVAVTGLQPGETLLGIDYRVARGLLYGLGSSPRLYRIDAATGVATAVGGPLAVTLEGSEFGFDFNPTVDRIRVVSDRGQNLRLHPDTGAVVDGNATLAGLQTDGALAFDAADVNAGKKPRVVAAGYTYNKQDEKITTNYAIDAATGSLVHQGSKEGVQPVVSPNTGRLDTVGSLKTAAFDRAALDISDVSNAAYAALTDGDRKASRWVRIDLATGAATPIGTIGGGIAVTGVAIEP
jgi:hypothetical protein